MSRFFKLFGTMRVRLTLSAALTMILAAILATVAAVVQLSATDQRLLEEAELGAPLRLEAEALASRLAALLTSDADEAPDQQERVRSWLSSRQSFCELGLLIEVETRRQGWRRVMVPLSRVLVTDASGRVLGGLPAAGDDSLHRLLPPAASDLVERALVADSAPAPSADGELETFYVAAPILGRDGSRRGAVYFEATTGPLSPPMLWRRATRMLRGTVGPASVLALGVALVLGMLSTRGLQRRLGRLRRTSAAWSRGDFEHRVDEQARDELGELARDLDAMASQLGELMEARRELAASEERNALARELHDTVKQNAFSVSMLLASVETLFEVEPQRARQLLTRARQASQETGRELATMIDQLRPALPGGLVAALRSYGEIWSQRHGIRTAIDAAGPRRLPRAAEEHLFLIAREALANVARHSEANRVELCLDLSPDGEIETSRTRVRLMVRDDGVGFERRESVGGFGLESMASRIAALGGRVAVESAKGLGTTVIAECTVEAAGAA